MGFIRFHHVSPRAVLCVWYGESVACAIFAALKEDILPFHAQRVPASMHSLATIPSDVLELIAYYAATSDLLCPLSCLPSLLSTCRSVHVSLTFRNNHGLYADIFRFKFDCAAPMRRFSNDPLRRTFSTGLGFELQARFEALHFMRSVVRTKKYIARSEDHITRYLWTIYFMCTESDEKNGLQLRRYGMLEDFLQISMEELLFPVVDSEQYLPETLDRTLVAWIMWMSTTWESLRLETEAQEDRIVKVISPIVFANFLYSASIVPWMIFRIPTRTQKDRDSSIIRFNPRSLDLGTMDRYAANVQLEDRSVVVPLYGSPLHITPPLLSHAALLSYFVRLEKRSLHGGSDLESVKFVSRRLLCMQDSVKLDGDFYRLRTCVDPGIWRRKTKFLSPGMFTGDWEGKFAFTDFDSFRDMLDGDDTAILSATIGQQPQVWSIREHHHNPELSSAIATWEQYCHSGIHRAPISTSPVLCGPTLNAHLPNDVEIEEVYPDSELIHCASFYSGIDQSRIGPMIHLTHHNLEQGHRVRSVYSTWSEEDTSIRVTPPRGRAVLPAAGYGATWAPPPLVANDVPAVSTTDGTQDTNEPLAVLQSDPEEDDERDIILTGKGHSAWGPFILKGRVRQWDGLVSIVKTYAGEEGRGTWLYRGYVLSGGIWVGRWRDTLTDEDTNGYEGVFAMTRRDDPMVET